MACLNVSMARRHRAGAPVANGHLVRDGTRGTVRPPADAPIWYCNNAAGRLAVAQNDDLTGMRTVTTPTSSFM